MSRKSIPEDQPRNYKILIASNDELSGVLMALAVQGPFGEIFKTSNGFEAIEICRRNPAVDLILMDINLPGKNCFDICRQIRTFNKKVTIIAQTTQTLASERKKALEAGCDDYLLKPAKKNDLIALIVNHLQITGNDKTALPGIKKKVDSTDSYRRGAENLLQKKTAKIGEETYRRQ
ncbi:response regulator [Sunxiuqinia sp. sy24]|uniref:response regulator n=1 Tax=Sunxiuqinia sp. sy24 TaxID=3461495 RepID=UPI0040463F87